MKNSIFVTRFRTENSQYFSVDYYFKLPYDQYSILTFWSNRRNDYESLREPVVKEVARIRRTVIPLKWPITVIYMGFESKTNSLLATEEWTGKNSFETRPELFDSFDHILANVSAMLPDEFNVNAFSGNWLGNWNCVTFSWPTKSIFRRNKFRFAFCFIFSVGLFLKYKSLWTFHKSLNDWIQSFSEIIENFRIFEKFLGSRVTSLTSHFINWLSIWKISCLLDCI